jgi:hypothetical protein
MRRTRTKFYFLFLLITGCVEPFVPETGRDAGNILVVDGSIDPAEQSAQVKLSRTIPIDADIATAPDETLAQVTIEAQNGSSYDLTELNDGTYRVTGITFTPGEKYRLMIRTSTGETYESEYTEVINTPPLDSVSWRTVGDVISVEANTHDFTGKSQFFIWSFEETFEYTAQLGSSYIWLPGGIITIRPYDQQVYRCWLTQRSTSIITGTSRQLSENVIRNFRVQSIPKGSEKVKFKYSILLRQRAISESEYDYWQELQRTTQNVGGLFDPMPAQVTGNFTCTSDPDKPVLGYFSASTTAEQRIFIRRKDLPEDFQVITRGEFCPVDSIPMNELGSAGGPIYIVSTYGMMRPEGYIVSTRECTDCTARPGSVNKQPIFWEE